jgi:hypothetical protein
VRAGEAAAVDARDAVTRRPADAAAFVTAADLARKSGEAVRRRADRWRDAARKWDSDPDLLARFDFEAPGPALVECSAARRDGTVVGCDAAEGRWPGKGALEFRGVGDRVRLDLPGAFPAVTLTAWVRVHGLDRAFNSLLMADGFDAGGLHWQVLPDGRVRLGVAATPTTRHADYDSPPLFPPDRFGRWTFLAVTYDGPNRRVTHYADGRAVRSAAVASAGPVRLGRCEIGNWNPAARADRTPIRHFSGRIDEVAVFRRALSAAEVAALYAAGAGDSPP